MPSPRRRSRAPIARSWPRSRNATARTPSTTPSASPKAVWNSFLEVVTEGYQGQRLHQHMAASLERILAGYFMACAIGIPLGLLMGLSTRVKAVFDPIVEFYRPLPPLALYTLLVMW